MSLFGPKNLTNEQRQEVDEMLSKSRSIMRQDIDERFETEHMLAGIKERGMRIDYEYRMYAIKPKDECRFEDVWRGETLAKAYARMIAAENARQAERARVDQAAAEAKAVEGRRLAQERKDACLARLSEHGWDIEVKPNSLTIIDNNQRRATVHGSTDGDGWFDRFEQAFTLTEQGNAAPYITYREVDPAEVRR